MSRILFLASLLSCSLLACTPDDVDSTDDTGLSGEGGGEEGGGEEGGGEEGGGEEGGGTGDGTIVGDWVSEGEDVAPFLADNYVKKVDAIFHDDGTFDVLVTATTGTQYNLAGTYVVDTGTEPAGIVLNQSSPEELISEGIYEVDGGTMTYEVVQTSPSQGCVPPTPAKGFGSTDCGGTIAEGDNVQIYRAQ